MLKRDPLPVVFRLLLGELRTQTLLHDLRGSLGTAMGWAELSVASGAGLSPGLMQALSVMHGHLSTVPVWWRAEEMVTRDLGAFVAEHTGLPVNGGRTFARFREEVLASCLRWAEPSDAHVLAAATDPGSRDSLASLHLRGLPTLGVAVACHPTLAEIERAEEEGLRTVATMALRCVARGGVGSIQSPASDELILNFRGGNLPS